MKSLSKLFLILFALVIIPKELNSNPISNEACSFIEVTGGAYVTINGKFGGDISRSDLESINEVGVAGCAAGSKIYRFDLYVHSGSKTTSYSGKSFEFTSEMTQALMSLKKGDTFEFKKTKAHLPNGNSVDVIARTFRVV